MCNILVTGVSKGIGKAICELLISEGHNVYGTYNTSTDLANELKNKYPDKLEIFQVDFNNRQSLLDFLDKIKDIKFKRVVNNAGVIEFEKFDDVTLDNWDKVINVNLTAPFIICHFLRNSIEDGGSIVNISSTDGMHGAVTSVAYSASKAGLNNLTQSLTNVFSNKKVRVNTVSPQFVGEGMDSPAINDAKWINPLNRTADYIEIANVVSFLLSDKSSFINGANIVVDGGTNAVDFFLKKESELI